jgi:hypothetical protein
VIYVVSALIGDLSAMPPTTTVMPFILLGVALLIALGFEFVNGFNDTANAVATVIYSGIARAALLTMPSRRLGFEAIVSTIRPCSDSLPAQRMVEQVAPIHHLRFALAEASCSSR